LIHTVIHYDDFRSLASLGTKNNDDTIILEGRQHERAVAEIGSKDYFMSPNRKKKLLIGRIFSPSRQSIKKVDQPLKRRVVIRHSGQWAVVVACCCLFRLPLVFSLFFDLPPWFQHLVPKKLIQLLPLTTGVYFPAQSTSI
jgi:hypothetical protein